MRPTLGADKIKGREQQSLGGGGRGGGGDSVLYLLSADDRQDEPADSDLRWRCLRWGRPRELEEVEVRTEKRKGKKRQSINASDLQGIQHNNNNGMIQKNKSGEKRLHTSTKIDLILICGRAGAALMRRLKQPKALSQRGTTKCHHNMELVALIPPGTLSLALVLRAFNLLPS